MAHALEFFGKEAGMAFAGETPWHGLGQQVDPNASLEEWRKQAHLDWCINRSPVKYEVPTGTSSFVNGEFQLDKTIKSKVDDDVLWRSDNGSALSVVSSKYKIVQPDEMVGFYKDLVGAAGFQMETLGSLDGGRKIWALAKTNSEFEVVAGDKVKGYLLLVTSCDGSLATTGMFTSVRVVCNNTLQLSLRKAENAVKVRHNTVFKPNAMKEELGIQSEVAFKAHIEDMRILAEQKMSAAKAEAFLAAMFKTAAEHGDITKTRGYQKVLGLFNGAGKGAKMEGVFGTKWGMLNAITEYVDFEIRAKNVETRFSSGQFGAGANIKRQAVELLTMVD